MISGLGICAGLGITLASIGVILKVTCPWVITDIRYINRIRVMLSAAKKRVKNKTMVIDIFEEQVQKNPEKAFIIFNGESFTYQFVNEQANRLATALLKTGMQQGQTVAVMMYNEPAFIWTFLGLQKIGIQTAFINVNLRGKGLLHCIDTVNPVALIVGGDPDLLSVVEDVKTNLPGTRLYMHGSSENHTRAGFHPLDTMMTEASPENVERGIRASIKLTDPSIFVYTSGTTGLPKAAIISHQRILIPLAIFRCYNLTPGDRVYICLPLYHTSALVLGVGNVISMGSSLVLARKFSASHFWEDCRAYSVNAFLYIGEMCRYLLTRPETPLDRNHNVRVAIGNGLRQDIYEEFKMRFNLENVFEFYGATEGVVGFTNLLNVSGSCGRSSPLLQKFLPCAFVKFDVDTQEPVRGEDGFCVPAELGEPGLLVTRITAGQTYDGYKGPKETNESKYLRDVFSAGDLYCNTGDLFTRDRDYNVYFNDRIGDTFRWKGENVSTTEVSTVLTELDFVVDAVVYGVTIPDSDGRAGMACLQVHDNNHQLLDNQLVQLHYHCKDRLPAYARPLFLRVAKETALTSTFKHTKVTLKREGWKKPLITDELYVFDKAHDKYICLDTDIYEKIESLDFKF